MASQKQIDQSAEVDDREAREQDTSFWKTNAGIYNDKLAHIEANSGVEYDGRGPTDMLRVSPLTPNSRVNIGRAYAEMGTYG